MREIVCITCPNSCLLTAVEGEDGSISVIGGKCPKGEEFALSELKNPMRTLCTTVRTAFPEAPVLPVRLSGEIPKGKILEVMAEINKATLRERLSLGDTVISNVLGLNVDVLASSSLLKEG